ncbi:MAG: glycosyltransferase [Verrucomicrobiota bacterium]
MNWTAKERAGKPVVACYCATFLTRDMQHVHRQVLHLKGVAPYVITQKRANADLFWFPDKYVAFHRKAWTRFFRRLWYQQIREVPWQINTGEVKELLHTVMRWETDVVHIYFGNVAMRLLPFIKVCPRPVVVSFHGADVAVDMEKPVYRERMGEVFDAATMVLARSESLKAALLELGCAEEKIRIQRTGIPFRSEEKMERALPPEDGRWRLIQACRLVEKKGLETTLRAFAEIGKRYPRATLTIAGDGPLKEAVRQMAMDLGVYGRVEFPGFLGQEELWNLYRRSHLFLHPSETGEDGNREGVPNAMLEGMSTGMPVAATRHGGIPEAVRDGESGILVEEGDWEGLAARSLELLGDEKAFERMGKAAREEVASKFNQAKQLGVLEGHYREAIEWGGPKGRG